MSVEELEESQSIVLEQEQQSSNEEQKDSKEEIYVYSLAGKNASDVRINQALYHL